MLLRKVQRTIWHANGRGAGGGGDSNLLLLRIWLLRRIAGFAWRDSPLFPASCTCRLVLLSPSEQVRKLILTQKANTFRLKLSDKRNKTRRRRRRRLSSCSQSAAAASRRKTQQQRLAFVAAVRPGSAKLWPELSQLVIAFGFAQARSRPTHLARTTDRNFPLARIMSEPLITIVIPRVSQSAVNRWHKQTNEPAAEQQNVRNNRVGADQSRSTIAQLGANWGAPLSRAQPPSETFRSTARPPAQISTNKPLAGRPFVFGRASRHLALQRRPLRARPATLSSLGAVAVVGQERLAKTINISLSSPLATDCQPCSRLEFTRGPASLLNSAGWLAGQK